MTDLPSLSERLRERARRMIALTCGPNSEYTVGATRPDAALLTEAADHIDDLTELRHVHERTIELLDDPDRHARFVGIVRQRDAAEARALSAEGELGRMKKGKP